MDFIRYIFLSAVCLSISFLTFGLFIRRGTHFRYMRLFLMVSVAVSLLLPLFTCTIDLSQLVGRVSTNKEMTGYLITTGTLQATEEIKPGFFEVNHNFLMAIYSVITITLIVRLLIQLSVLVSLYIRAEKGYCRGNILLFSDKIRSPFSFFRWIFIPREISGDEEKESIIAHESVHASQYHSVDNMLIEFVTAVMWFNPLVWMMKRSIHLVHEYLADEGALGTGIDRLRYQALLINQVTEERLICLSSSFNHSLIKKRMIMMTKSKNYQSRKLKILSLIPLSALLVVVVSILNGLFPEKATASEVINESVVFDIPSSAAIPAVIPVIQDDTVKKKRYKLVVETNGSKKSETTTVMISDKGNADSIIYVVDGVHVKDISCLDTDSIKTINVIKEDNVIIIRTKESGNEHKGRIVIKVGSSVLPDGAIIYIDGKESTKEELKKLDPDQIESVTIKKEGDSKGIIQITTKQKNQ